MVSLNALNQYSLVHVSASGQESHSIQSCIEGIFSFSVFFTIENFSHLRYGW